MKDVLLLVLLFWEGCSFYFLGGVFYCWRGGPFLGVSASHAPTCTESNGHVISYCPITRSKVNDTMLQMETFLLSLHSTLINVFDDMVVKVLESFLNVHILDRGRFKSHLINAVAPVAIMQIC